MKATEQRQWLNPCVLLLASLRQGQLEVFLSFSSRWRRILVVFESCSKLATELVLMASSALKFWVKLGVLLSSPLLSPTRRVGGSVRRREHKPRGPRRMRRWKLHCISIESSVILFSPPSLPLFLSPPLSSSPFLSKYKRVAWEALHFSEVSKNQVIINDCEVLLKCKRWGVLRVAWLSKKDLVYPCLWQGTCRQATDCYTYIWINDQAHRQMNKWLILQSSWAKRHVL